MNVSPANRERALLILDAILDAAFKAGGKIEASTKTKRPLLRLRGELFELSIREPARRT